MIDELTQLKSRKCLVGEIGNRSDLMVATFNIDYFRETNSCYGDAMGDKLLKHAAKILSETFPDFQVYRINGATFAIKAPYCNKTYLSIVGSLNSFLIGLQRDNATVDGSSFHMHMSAGVAFGIKPLARAEIALLQAKQENKRIVISVKETSCRVSYESNFKAVENIKSAIANNNLVPFFQAIQNLKTGKVEKYECLARIVQGGEVISPYHFIELAKKIKMYSDITQAMITKSINKFRDTNLEFNLNLDATDLTDPLIQNFLIDEITRSGVGNRLTVEVVETEALEGSENLTEFFTRIRGLGVKIAIDDYGTGYSNLSMLKIFKPDTIKIDGTLISDIENIETYSMIKMLVDHAHNLNISVVGEFVSSKEIYDLCVEVGIDYGQGFYIAEPRPELIS